MSRQDIELMAHLMRRAGFGATRDEIGAHVADGYEATVERLLSPGDPDWMGDYLVRRFDHEASGMINHRGGARSWLYRMISTTAPLQEKMTLFWHGIFATGVCRCPGNMSGLGVQGLCQPHLPVLDSNWRVRLSMLAAVSLDRGLGANFNWQ